MAGADSAPWRSSFSITTTKRCAKAGMPSRPAGGALDVEDVPGAGAPAAVEGTEVRDTGRVVDGAPPCPAPPCGAAPHAASTDPHSAAPAVATRRADRREARCDTPVDATGDAQVATATVTPVSGNGEAMTRAGRARGPVRGAGAGAGAR